MARPKPQFSSKTINLSALCKLAKVGYYRLYWRTKKAPQDNLPLIDRTKLANTLIADISPFLSSLGFDVSIKQKAD